MKVISGLNQLETEGLSDVAATIGTFDGVHPGHRKIIDTLLRVADEQKLRSTLVTFNPHPQIVLGTRGPVEILTTLEEKLELLASTGIDTVVVLDFNKQLASYPPEDFVREVLIKKLGMKALVFGYDHAFGKNRAGNSQLLEKMSKTDDFYFSVVPEFKMEGQAIKSTFIRNELKSGDYARAVEFLGYNYFITGKIVRGHGIGKTLGFPTINLAVPPGKLLPREGVYSASARFDGAKRSGMAYIGQRLTFNDKTLSVEVNLFDFDGQVESERAVLELMEYIRAPKKFDSPETLAKKMKNDEVEIKKRIG